MLTVAVCSVLVQGRDDTELPEVILATGRVDKYALANAVTFEEMQAMSDLHRAHAAENGGL